MSDEKKYLTIVDGESIQMTIPVESKYAILTGRQLAEYLDHPYTLVLTDEHPHTLNEISEYPHVKLEATHE